MEEKEAEERIEYLLNKGGMSKADMDKFPYEFPGGLPFCDSLSICDRSL